MREFLRRRLETVEEAHRLANGPPQTVSIFFVNPDGSRASPVVARGASDFACWRHEGEEEMEFQARAKAECRAFDPRPLHILVFPTG
jgi:hypothetical protein